MPRGQASAHRPQPMQRRTYHPTSGSRRNPSGLEHHRQRRGHPWEVCRGGNSTHVDLYVQHDRGYLDYLFRSGQISESEYHKKIDAAGYFFVVAGKYRATEALKFYTSLSAAGLPVILNDADEIRARYDGSGYVGIVPRSCPTRYCEGLFPEKYGRIIDFVHVYEEEMAHFGDAIEWLPEEEAELITTSKLIQRR